MIMLSCFSLQVAENKSRDPGQHQLNSPQTVVNGGMYDRKSDPEAKITRTGPLIICCTRLLPRAVIDQIQASSKNYSECLYITDLVSVISFHINRYITLEITTTGRSKNSLPINTQIRPSAN